VTSLAAPVESRSRAGSAVARSVLFLVLGQIATAAISFGVTALLARHLGAHDYGVFYLAATLVQTAFFLVDLGQEYYLVGRVAVEPRVAGTLLGSGGALRLLAGLAVFPVLGALAALLDYPETTRDAITLTIGVFLAGTIGDGIYLVMRGLERMDLEAALRVASKLAMGIATVIAVLTGGSIEAILTLQIVGALAVLPVYFIALRSVGLARPRFSRGAAAVILSGGAPFLLLAVAVNAQPSIDALLLSVLTPASVMGWYAAATKLVGLLIFPANMVGAGLYPTLSRLGYHDRARFEQLVAAALRVAVLLGVLAAAGTYLFADAAIAIVYGSEGFGAAASNLRVLAGNLPLLFIDITLGAAIMAAGIRRQWIVAKVASLVVAAGVGLALVPPAQSIYGNGGLGCAAAAIASELVMFTAGVLLVPLREIRLVRVLGKDLACCAAAAMAMAGSAWLLRGATPLLAMAVASVTYLAATYVFGAIRRDDVRFLGEVIRLRSSA
jgi:O-antigen/teichoic acid export membrane protein